MNANTIKTVRTLLPIALGLNTAIKDFRSARATGDKLALADAAVTVAKVAVTLAIAYRQYSTGVDTR